MKAVIFLSLLIWAASGLHSPAQLQWDTPEIEVTAKPTDTKITREFTFQNKGEATITILSIQTSCDCTSAKVESKTYTPGERGKLLVTFTVGAAKGAVEKNILVKTNSPRKFLHCLTLKVKIPPRIAR